MFMAKNCAARRDYPLNYVCCANDVITRPQLLIRKVTRNGNPLLDSYSTVPTILVIRPGNVIFLTRNILPQNAAVSPNVSSKPGPNSSNIHTKQGMGQTTSIIHQMYPTRAVIARQNRFHDPYDNFYVVAGDIVASPSDLPEADLS